ncbi:MAG: hypothetical protein A2665_01960 [Candidatus Zambryskibacteria bacterium RIFCSPHIGHO2_01_FULL_46_30]|uniref:Response regulatory domain-containing protein n=1 Tax=Candidatus Zambryskibacteria bacterium RIFCSPHIGHO2_01_FULL_46_30 TaxID=1802739 RepID=A0A1G2T3I8_9BACT|nr:MAG: hypothetical protein A2665_01960 [Candidatus Zambryskibacteria bacterium RIFCSPHIGHO2_01_FULL_46_30]OHB05267.1 MAG: hypothetical protein A3B22_03225 [Candidatus Zambryskibacteria bacterium RIFCSPLOWO2_01_FULL_47_33]
MRILIVDDSEGIRLSVEDIVGHAGHSAVVASNGREAWELLGQGEFDLIISDNAMPERSGVELLKMVRAGARTTHIPFVLMSGDRVVSKDNPTSLEDVCAKFGATFLYKPFPLHALFSVLGVGVELCD